MQLAYLYNMIISISLTKRYINYYHLFFPIKTNITTIRTAQTSVCKKHNHESE